MECVRLRAKDVDHNRHQSAQQRRQGCSQSARRLIKHYYHLILVLTTAATSTAAVTPTATVGGHLRQSFDNIPIVRGGHGSNFSI